MQLIFVVQTFIIHNAYTNVTFIHLIYLFQDKLANGAKVGQITLPDLSIKRLGVIVRCVYILNRHVSNNIRRLLPAETISKAPPKNKDIKSFEANNNLTNA